MRFINILFWNINKKPLYEPLEKLTVYYDLDVIILCEYENVDIEHLQRKLSVSGKKFEVGNNIVSGRTVLLHSLNKNLKCVLDNKYYSAFKIKRDEEELLLFAVHLPSKLKYGVEDQFSKATQCSREIQQKEEEFNVDNTIVIGDFNMNPFEQGMISSDGFHGTMFKDEAIKLKRTVLGEHKKYFYNPMWSYMGNGYKPVLGTYYYRDNKTMCYHWNTFDQILLRPSLIKEFSLENINIIHDLGDSSLIKNNKPYKQGYSDHLPVLLSI